MVSKQSLTPFFSIITCTKNSARFVEKCLRSVKIQTYQNFEHIIVDGKSTDATCTILKRYGKSIVSVRPRGIAHAMNVGIGHARGKYLYFLNSDDSLYDPQVLQEVHDFLIRHPKLDWAFGNIHETTGQKTIGFPPKRKIFRGRHPNLLKYYNYIPHQGVFIKRKIFQQFGSFNEALKSMLDPEFWLRIAPHTAWDYMPYTIAHYLIRPDSQSEDKAHAKSNTREYESVQACYLGPWELRLATCINKLLR